MDSVVGYMQGPKEVVQGLLMWLLSRRHVGSVCWKSVEVGMLIALCYPPRPKMLVGIGIIWI